MNPTDLRTFLAIAETGSLVRASERLSVTQSTVTARLRNLEDELGQKLFYRHKSGAKLTSAGVRFKRYAEAMASLWRQGATGNSALRQFRNDLQHRMPHRSLARTGAPDLQRSPRRTVCHSAFSMAGRTVGHRLAAKHRSDQRGADLSTVSTRRTDDPPARHRAPNPGVHPQGQSDTLRSRLRLCRCRRGVRPSARRGLR